jgi:Ca2+/Na+ antiporter
MINVYRFCLTEIVAIISLLFLERQKIQSIFKRNVLFKLLAKIIFLVFIIILIVVNPISWLTMFILIISFLYFRYFFDIDLFVEKLEILKIQLEIDRALINSNLFDAKHKEDTYVLTPPIRVEIEETKGKIFLKSSFKIDERLSKIDIEAVLSDWRQIDVYREINSNEICFEVEKKGINKKLVFKSEDEFKSYCYQFADEYTFFIDKNNTKILLQHFAVFAETGAGKTISLITILRQLLLKNKPLSVVIYDIKNSDLRIFVNENKNKNLGYYSSIPDILESMRELKAHFEKRKQKIAEKKQKLGQTQNFQPLIILFEEYVNLYNSPLLKKEEREFIFNIVQMILMEGRELNVYLWLVSQSPNVDSANLKTHLKAQFGLVLALRPPLNPLFLETIFGKDVIPQKNFNYSFEVGTGYLQNKVLSKTNKTTTPKIVEFPKMWYFD